jgi:hypothetical protein
MEVSGQLFAPAAWNPGRTPLDIVKVAVWVSEEAGTCWRRKKSVSIAAIRTPDRLARSPVTIDLSRDAYTVDGKVPVISNKPNFYLFVVSSVTH